MTNNLYIKKKQELYDWVDYQLYPRSVLPVPIEPMEIANLRYNGVHFRDVVDYTEVPDPFEGYQTTLDYINSLTIDDPSTLENLIAMYNSGVGYYCEYTGGITEYGSSASLSTTPLDYSTHLFDLYDFFRAYSMGYIPDLDVNNIFTVVDNYTNYPIANQTHMYDFLNKYYFRIAFIGQIRNGRKCYQLDYSVDDTIESVFEIRCGVVQPIDNPPTYLPFGEVNTQPSATEYGKNLYLDVRRDQSDTIHSYKFKTITGSNLAEQYYQFFTINGEEGDRLFTDFPELGKFDYTFISPITLQMRLRTYDI